MMPKSSVNYRKEDSLVNNSFKDLIRTHCFFYRFEEIFCMTFESQFPNLVNLRSIHLIMIDVLNNILLSECT